MLQLRLKINIQAVIISALLLPVSLINLGLIELFGDKEFLLLIIEIELFIIYLYALYITIMKRGIYSIESFFLITLCFFSLFAVFISLFGMDDFLNSSINIIVFIWKTKTASVILNYYILFLSIFIIFIFLMKNPEDNRLGDYQKTDLSKQLDKRIAYFSEHLMLISLPFAVAYRVKYAFAVLSLGRTTVYAGGINLGGTVNMLLHLMDYTFLLSFYFICASEEDSKKFDRYGILFLAVACIDFLYGSRAGAVCNILFFVFFRYKLFGKKIPTPIIGTLGCIFVVLLAYIGAARLGYFFDFSRLFQEVFRFLSVESRSINIAGYYYQNREILSNNTYPYILDPIIRLFLVLRYPEIYNHGQSMEMLNTRMSLSHHVTYSISANYYLNGSGAGSNMIAEMSEFGYIGVLFWSIVFMLIFKWYTEHLLDSRFMRFMSCQFISFLLFAPRATPFFDTYTLAKFGVIYLFGMAFFHIIPKKQIKTYISS